MNGPDDLQARLAALSPAKRALVLRKLQAAKGSTTPPVPAVEAIPRIPRDGPLPLSHGQERFWFLDRMDEHTAAYHVPLALRLRGPLGEARLRAAVDAVAARHEALRTTFAAGEDGPRQIVHAALPPAFAVVDAVGDDLPAREAHARALLEADAARPFDLATGPLVRLCLIRLGTDDRVLGCVMHHIVSDGWSLGVFFDEVCRHYAGASAPPPLALQYPDYATWQRERLAGPLGREQLAFWRDRLDGAPPVLELPTDRPRPARKTFRGGAVPFRIGAEPLAAAERLADGASASLFMVLFAAWGALLARYARQDDLIVGTPIANRTRRELEPLIGFFVNTLALRVAAPDGIAFRDLVGQVRQTALDAYAHQDLPFEQLVEALQPDRDLAHTPLFQVMFILQNAPAARQTLDDLTTEAFPVEPAHAMFDLTLSLTRIGDGLEGLLSYNADLFDRATVERFVRHYRALLDAGLARPDEAVDAIDLRDDAECARMAEWNATARTWPATTVPDLIAAQAATTPDAVALTGADGDCSYATLDAHACRIAQCLANADVGPGAAVGILADRGPASIAAILGALRAGAAYVPMDPAYPAERIREMLADSQARAVLTTPGLAAAAGLAGPVHGDALPGQAPDTAGPDEQSVPVLFDLDVLLADASAAACLPKDAGTTLRPAGPDDPAYILYTSGSTGRPKGVVMPHRALANLVQWHRADPRLGRPARTLQFAALTFDVSFQEIAVTLATGGTLVLVDEETRRDLRALARHVDDAGIERLFVPFIALQQLAECWRTAPPARLRDIVTAGEQLQITPAVRALFAARPDARLHNHYGPTETHVVTALPLEGDPADWPALPGIGAPLANVTVRILDAAGRPQPVGVPGELCVGGACLADGYLGQFERTVERFVPDPAGPGRLYRTGDLARWRPDGTLAFLGRADRQVKIRGVRIEPGEIEARLAGHPDVRDAAVVARDDGAGPRLVAYVTPAGDAAPAPATLRTWLADRLPDAMVPAAVVVLPALPLTSSGKVDRRRLPAPAPEMPLPPGRTERSPVERLLADLWSELLGVPVVGSDDNWFALGGHSLLATRLLARVEALFGIDLPMRTLFEQPTLAAFAEVVAHHRTGTAEKRPGPVPAPRDAPLPLSFAQERLWFLDRLEGGSANYNMPAGVRLRGPLEVDALRAALADLVDRHEVLRTAFPLKGDRPVQHILERLDLPVPLDDLADVPPDAREAAVRDAARRQAIEPFGLATGPLVRAQILRLDPEEHVLLFCLHHIVCDGWSMGIVLDELAACYDARRRDAPPALPPLPIQYADFAAWERSDRTAARLDDDLAWWRETLADLPPAPALPFARPAPDDAPGPCRIVEAPVDPDTVAVVRRLCRETGATPFMAVLAAFGAVLHRLAGADDLVLGATIANRTRPELEGLVGFFVNSLVLRLPVTPGSGFRILLAEARRVVLDGHAHQELPFDRLVRELAPARAGGRQPLFQIVLSHQPAPPVPAVDDGLRMEPVAAFRGAAKYDIVLATGEVGDGLSCAIEYDAARFDEIDIRRLADCFVRALAAGAAAPDTPVADLPILEADPADDASDATLARDAADEFAF